MEKENKNYKELKVCDICKINATSLCFNCNSYFCDSCFKFVHDKQVNSNHKKENIDPFIPIDLKCPDHPQHIMSLFFLFDKGN